MKKFFSLFLLTCFSINAQANLSIPQNVRNIFKYECTRTFLSGSGVHPNTLACTDGMQLEYYKAAYDFYLYQDQSSNNFDMKMTTQFYNGGENICGLKVPAIECSDALPELQFGLSTLPLGNFNIAIRLSANETSSGFMGYAAATDVSGQCPAGLLAIRAYVAQPPSIPNSNFINQNNSLNNLELSAVIGMPSDYVVTRFLFSGECKNGICPAPSAQGQAAFSVPYIAQNPTVCVIAPGNL